jgi:DNA-binding transcriptional LysR family regulator
LLFEIANKYPALQLSMTFSDHLVDPFEEGIDLLVRFGELKDTSGLVARRLTRQRWAICAAPSYLVCFGVPQTLEELSHHHCIVGHRRGQPLSWRVRQGLETVRYAPPSAHQIGDGEAMILAAVAGVGLCQMPRCLFRDDIEAGRLVEVLEAYEPDAVDVHAVWPKVSHLRPKVRYVVDELVKLCEHWQ